MKIRIAAAILLLGSASVGQSLAQDLTAPKESRTLKVISESPDSAIVASAVEMELKSGSRYKIVSENAELLLDINCLPIKGLKAETCMYIWTIFQHSTSGGLSVDSDPATTVKAIVQSFTAATTETKLMVEAINLSMFVEDYCRKGTSANARMACAASPK